MKKSEDLAGFEAWLRERRLTAEHCVGHFSRWVARFLGLRRSRPRETWQDTLTVFLQDLGDGRYKPWQVRQAGDAVTLYCGQFCERLETPVAPTAPARGRGGAPGKGSRSGSAGEEVLTHPEMLAEARRILRLRHYAGSTERSYLGWNRRFLRYVGRSGEHLPTGDDVQAFLSHLAVQGKVSASTQNQAFHAVLFLLRHVLVVDPGDLSGTVRAGKGDKDRVTPRLEAGGFVGPTLTVSLDLLVDYFHPGPGPGLSGTRATTGPRATGCRAAVAVSEVEEFGHECCDGHFPGVMPSRRDGR